MAGSTAPPTQARRAVWAGMLLGALISPLITIGAIVLLPDNTDDWSVDDPAPPQAAAFGNVPNGGAYAMVVIGAVFACCGGLPGMFADDARPLFFLIGLSLPAAATLVAVGNVVNGTAVHYLAQPLTIAGGVLFAPIVLLCCCCRGKFEQDSMASSSSSGAQTRLLPTLPSSDLAIVVSRGGHCAHCAGQRGVCACPNSCPRPAWSQCLTVAVGANRINLILVIDKSGSMAGSSWSAVQRGVREAVAALTANDYVSIITFNEEVRRAAPPSFAIARCVSADACPPYRVAGRVYRTLVKTVR